MVCTVHGLVCTMVHHLLQGMHKFPLYATRNVQTAKKNLYRKCLFAGSNNGQTINFTDCYCSNRPRDTKRDNMLLQLIAANLPQQPWTTKDHTAQFFCPKPHCTNICKLSAYFRWQVCCNSCISSCICCH